jgi:phosphoglycolate phosphatase-like HAD superfamily hydrolase
VNRLAIFDIDGTLTDTNGVDDDCYRAAVADALDIDPGVYDWAKAAHITDAGIFQWVAGELGRPAPSSAETDRAIATLGEQLAAVCEREPHRFAEIAGARAALSAMQAEGWCVAVATGCWGVSARLKLRAAGIEVPGEVVACADDAIARADIVQLAQRRAERHYDRTFDRVVSLGDGPWDVRAAIELNMPFIGMGGRESELRELGASTVLRDYRDLDAFRRALSEATAPAARSHPDVARSAT